MSSHAVGDGSGVGGGVVVGVSVGGTSTGGVTSWLMSRSRNQCRPVTVSFTYTLTRLDAYFVVRCAPTQDQPVEPALCRSVHVRRTVPSESTSRSWKVTVCPTCDVATRPATCT